MLIKHVNKCEAFSRINCISMFIKELAASYHNVIVEVGFPLFKKMFIKELFDHFSWCNNSCSFFCEGACSLVITRALVAFEVLNLIPRGSEYSEF